MIISNYSQLDPNTIYTYADYLMWEFEERIELINGSFFHLSSSLGTRHQLVLGEVFFRLSNYLRRSPCKVFPAPFDVRLSLLNKPDNQKVYTVVQPDICVICDPEKIDSKGCIGAPDLIIEILSPGNTEREMNDKFDIYEENGVKEYWLVEPNDRIVLVYILNESGKYIGLKPFTESETLQSRSIEGFEILVKDIFDV